MLFTVIAYVFFELLTLGFVGTFFAIFSLYAFIACCAVVISVYDIRHMIIADLFAYAWMIAGIMIQVLGIAWMGISSLSLLNILAGPLFFVFFWSLWYFSKGTWMGGGDAKIGLAIGLTLGFSRGITAITLGFWIGAVYGLVLMTLSRSRYISKRVGLRTEVPFGPFLIIGFFLALLCNLDLVWMSGLFAF
jgi:leader peptidase (prepilin peptidase)/N-methyltransferase